jgi:2-isopropylmalate synthase
VVFSAHCHDDLGLAVANSLAAIQGGVRQVECTINGIGERAGNASVEEIVMALRVRSDRFPFTTGIETTALYGTSQLLTQLTSESVQANKAIVGRNAFAHEAGIHQDGVLKDPSTYEIMRPQDVGQPAGQLVLGRHSGRHAVQQRCDALGLAVTAPEIELVYHSVVSLGENRKAVGDGDLRRIIERIRNPKAPAPGGTIETANFAL